MQYRKNTLIFYKIKNEKVKFCNVHVAKPGAVKLNFNTVVYSSPSSATVVFYIHVATAGNNLPGRAPTNRHNATNFEKVGLIQMIKMINNRLTKNLSVY